jgi:hypothetical protein
MQDCDRAVEDKLLDKAKTTLEQMKRLTAIDSRFNIAVLEYERQVFALEEALQREGKTVRPALNIFRPPSAPIAPRGWKSSSPLPPVSPSSSASDVTRLFSMGDGIPAATTTAQDSGSFPSEGGFLGRDTNDPRGNVYLQDLPIPPEGLAPEKSLSARGTAVVPTARSSRTLAVSRDLAWHAF